MNEVQMKEALYNLACPSCSKAGFLKEVNLDLEMNHKDQVIKVRGDGHVCMNCNVKFMSNELTANVSNQMSRIDGNHSYITVNETGDLATSMLN